MVAMNPLTAKCHYFCALFDKQTMTFPFPLPSIVTQVYFCHLVDGIQCLNGAKCTLQNGTEHEVKYSSCTVCVCVRSV